MSGSEPALQRNLPTVIRTAAVATVSFLVLAWVTTQVESIRSSLPFTEDPYDAAVSFAVIGIVMVGGATIFRAIVHARRRYDPLVERRITIGGVLALAMAVIALASDVIALLVVGVDPSAAGVPLVLGLLGVSIVAAAFAWRARAALVRSPAAAEREPDMLDDLGSLAGTVGAARAADGLAAWVDRSPLSPRRHRIAVGVLGGTGAGIAAVA